MRRNWWLGLCLGSMLAVLGAVAPVDAAATISVVHGINGTDLGAEEDLPVNVTIDGPGDPLVLEDVTFRTISTPLSIPAGAYTITVTPAEGGNPLLLIAVQIVDATSYSAAVCLDKNGIPSLPVFVNHTAPLSATKGRLTFRHTAAASPVDVRYATFETLKKLNTIRYIKSGQSASPLDVDMDFWLYCFFPADYFQPVARPAGLVVRGYHSYVVYLVGSSENGTVEVLVQDLNFTP